MRQLRDLALAPAAAADWPPRLPTGFNMGGEGEPWAASPRASAAEAEAELLRRAIRAARASRTERNSSFFDKISLVQRLAVATYSPKTRKPRGWQGRFRLWR
jgi:hypothetical protein